MDEISVYGVDTAKSVFQVHGENAARRVKVVKRLRRGQFLTFFARQPASVVIFPRKSGRG